MHIGRLLIAKPTSSGADVVVFTGWFPAGGDNARFAYEIIDHNSTTGPDTNFVVRVFTKNSEDAGDGTEVTLTSWTTVPSSTSFREASANGGLEELVRFQITIAEEDDAWYLYRFLKPVWYSTAT